jgi:hypothetical protein
VTEPTQTDGSTRASESTAPESNGSERECPACGDIFEDGAAYRDHLFSVGLVY